MCQINTEPMTSQVKNLFIILEISKFGAKFQNLAPNFNVDFGAKILNLTLAPKFWNFDFGCKILIVDFGTKF
jgi:hypothetical protein